MAIDPTTLIYGRHAVRELLALQPHRAHIIYLSPSIVAEFAPLAQKHNIKVEPLAHGYFVKELGDVVHQGVVARISIAGIIRDYKEFINSISITPQTALVILDEVSDPHNVGAVVRSATAFGASAVLVPRHNQSSISGAVVKASAGTALHLPIVEIKSEAHAIEDLKKRGFWIYGLAGDCERSLYEEKFDAPTVFIVGNEGSGLRKNIRDNCDVVLRIPIATSVESLNASVSVAVALSHWSSQLQDR